MKKTPQQVRTCLQCEGDEMLEVRKYASELFKCMEILDFAYGVANKRKPGTTIPQFVEALVAAEKDQQRLIAMLKTDATRKLREINNLISGLGFVAKACKRGASGVTVGSNEIQIGIAELLQTAIKDLESLTHSYRGLLENRQPHNEVNFIKPLMQ